MVKVIKRSGIEVAFDKEKIIRAVTLANNEVNASDRLTADEILDAVNKVVERVEPYGRSVHVEEIQDFVEEELMRSNSPDTARKYIRYRHNRELARAGVRTDAAILSLVEYDNEEIKQENSNKNPEIIPTQRDYIAGEVSKDVTARLLLDQKIVQAHNEGLIHFHDSDYFIQHAHNCDLINLEDMLQNGTVISGVMIEKPHTFSTACTIMTQIVAQVASSQYGGQSVSLEHLAPFVNETRKKFTLDYASLLNHLDEKTYKEFIEKLVYEDIKRGVQTIQYQVITLMTTNGQAPFITVYMDINEAKDDQEKEDLALVISEVLKQRTQGVKNESGAWITPAFPKLIYVLDENNIEESSEYVDLTISAAKCTAKRMVPDYISAKIMRELKGDVYTCMGCRSFLTPDRTTENVANAKNYVAGKKYYGRFNQGVVTINLVDVALSSGGDIYEFYKILEDRLENLCYPALMARHKRLLGTVSDVAPILWQHGALARLKTGETIDKLLYGGYSTISLGYAGLYECVRYMTGESHTSGAGKVFGLDVMQKLNDACARWRDKTDIDFSLYGTPLESTTYRFAKCLQKRFGKIPEVTDHNYITNSYHVNVREEIDAFTKLKIESEFQKLSPGGAISYVETPNMTNNIEAVLSVMRFIYDNIMYAELNTKSDYCQECGYDGEIEVVKDDSGKLVWRCPKCGCMDEHKLNVARRTCGYIGTNFWNQGRTEEIAERVLHL